MPWELTGNPDGDIGANNFLGTRANDPLRIRTRSSVNNADAMTIIPAPDAATTGNVGIGTASPRSRLQLKSLTAIDEGASTSGDWANFGQNAYYDGAWKRIDPTKTGANFHINPEGAGQEFRFLKMQANGQERNIAVIGTTTSFIAEGNVGIGTATPGAKLAVNGDVEVTGDIRLLGADCAENFDVWEAEAAEPGTVMVIDQEGTLKPSEQPYDKRVAGVVSGAGGLKPGIILDKQEPNEGRLPVALMGKVTCKVDARYSPIEVGDLLTTSPTAGYAMKAKGSRRAFGAVLGKALRALNEGIDTIPVMVALQ